MEEAVRATQERLGKFVKRPPLTDKLLRKPPFRFLHDIVTSVHKTNGIFEGLFDENELVSDNVKDRDAKIDFLNKVINVLTSFHLDDLKLLAIKRSSDLVILLKRAEIFSKDIGMEFGVDYLNIGMLGKADATTGQSLTVKPSKIIAGQEPEKTNELLQCIGLLLEQNLSTDDAVTKYNQSTKPSQIKDRIKNRDQSKDKVTSRTKEENKLTSRSSEKITQRDRREPSQTRKDASRERDRSTTRKPEKIIPKSKSIEKNPKVSPPKRTANVPKMKKSNSKILIEKLQRNSEPAIREYDQNEITREDTNDSILPSHELLIAVHNEQLTIPLDNVLNSDESEINLNENDNVNKSNDDMDMETLTMQTQLQENLKIEPLIRNEQSLYSKSEINKSTANELSENTSKQNKVFASDRRIDQSPKKEFPLQRELTEIKRQHKFDERKPPLVSEIKNEDHDKPQPQISKPTTPATNTKNTLRPPSVRPPSARPGAPRLRDKHEDVLASADPVPMGKVNVIVENMDADAEEEESSLVIVESSEQQQLEKTHDEEIALQYSSGDHGHLVQQILDSQKEFNQMKTGKTDIEWEFGAQRAREASGLETEQMRFGLQALSRAANPLGKLLDHIQEDVEVMRQELEHWTKTYVEASAELTRQKSSNEQSLQPLQAKIKQLDAEIVEKRDKIYDLKLIIHKNSARIDKLLASGNVQ